MLKLIIVAFLFALAISFACGYGVREAISRRRRKEARKKFYEKYSKPKLDSHAPKTETPTGPTRRELTIQELHERLSRLEDRIAGIALEIDAFRDEARREFVATRELLEPSSSTPKTSH